MKKAICSILIIFSVSGGCGHSALLNMRREASETEQRIATKERQLEDLEKQEKFLTEEKKSLLTELDTKKMTLDQLSGRLEKLKRQNDDIRTYNDRQRKEKENLEMQIKRYQEDIDELQINQLLTIEEKKRRIDDLKENIRAYLKMGLR